MTKRGASENYTLTPEQQIALWQAAVDPEEKLLVGLLMMAGLRISEATHMKASWIQEGKICIPAAMKCGCLECATEREGEWKPKTEAGVRQIPIAKPLQPVLEQFFSKKPKGLQVTRQAAWTRLKRLGQRAGIKYVFPHALRATYATTLANFNSNATTICYLLGQSEIKVGEHYINMARAAGEAGQKIREIYG